MAMVDLWSPLRFPRVSQSTANFSNSAVTNDAAGEYCANVFRVLDDGGAISAVGFYIGTATGSPTADIRVETVGTDGLPSGTLWATNTNVVSGALTANTFQWLTLTANATVVRGDIVAIKCLYNSGTSYQAQKLTNFGMTGFPYGVQNTGTPAKTADLFIAGIKYNDGTVRYTGMPISSSVSSFTSGAVRTNTTPDEVGLKITVPVNMSVSGIGARLTGGTISYDLIVYDNSSNVLASVTCDGDAMGASWGNEAYFASELSLTSGTTYRVIFKPLDTTGAQLSRVTLPDAASRGAWEMGTIGQYTSRTDAGAWSDDSTIVPNIWLIVSQIDDGSGSGGGGVPFVGRESLLVRAA